MSELADQVEGAQLVAHLLALLEDVDTLAAQEENPQLTSEQARAIAKRQTQEWLEKPSGAVKG